MNKSEELWNAVVKEGLSNYNNRREQPEIQTLFLVGTPKSVKTNSSAKFIFPEKNFTLISSSKGENNSYPCISG